MKNIFTDFMIRIMSWLWTAIIVTVVLMALCCDWGAILFPYK